MNETYFEWLLSLIDVSSNEPLFSIVRTLDKITYRWHFAMDVNRSLAGKNLRTEYMCLTGAMDEEMPGGECTVLEMMVAMAERFSENADISVGEAFYEMCRNLEILPGLLQFGSEEEVLNKVNKWLNGDQDVHAFPGPFPLYHYIGDARNLDLWSLMNIYISEHYPLKKDWLN